MNVLESLKALLQKMGSSAPTASIVEALNRIGDAEGSQAASAGDVAAAISRIAEAYAPAPPVEDFNGITFSFTLGASSPEPPYSIRFDGCGTLWDRRDPDHVQRDWTYVREYSLIPGEAEHPMNFDVNCPVLGVRVGVADDGPMYQTRLDATQGSQRVHLGMFYAPSGDPVSVDIVSTADHGVISGVELELTVSTG